ncbi:MAG: hypothetical protein IKA87_04400 [Lentisphaeria bacterium]|nr:hypothetical protein [Lentisphaeria bacterium]
MRYAALNPIADGVQLAVMEDNILLFTSFAPMRSREASALPGFVEKELAGHSLSISDISFWSTGAGPGGFTALRMTAALIAAWAFEHENIKFRCVPGAIALAGSLPGREGEMLDCLFDGRNNEILLYGLIFRNGRWESRNENAILNENAFRSCYTPDRRYVVNAAELDAVRKITGTVALETREPDCSELIKTQAFEYDNDPDKLVYIREAVELRP